MNFKKVPLAEVLEKYPIRDHLFGDSTLFDERIDTGFFYVNEGDMLIEDHVDLNIVNAPGDIQGIIITGNLVVFGNILNHELDFGLAFYVMGNITCDNFLIGGAATYIGGNLSAREVILLHYSAGWMQINGLISSRVMIVDDYPFIPKEMNITQFYDNSRDENSPKENACFRDESGNYRISNNLKALLNMPDALIYEDIIDELSQGSSVLLPL
ncbi:hypothetical protein LX64_00891 [Chitinophaga skermanii]|uniref:Polymer-forming protein n=1 Tax=Chitinophaga skermanii TaxID=331697 RepID=A0A327QWZ8_9BACT|nr:hypothetical protein [Chitinophaga skermanii]RAJ08244.1 hypothetical protein LX64_00891 [Chitinophaga skermanii]